MPTSSKLLGVLGNRDRAAVTPADLAPARNTETEVPLTRVGGGEAILNVTGTGERVAILYEVSGWRSDWTLRLEVGGLSVPYSPSSSPSTEFILFTPPGPGRVRFFVTRTASTAKTFRASGFLAAVVAA